MQVGEGGEVDETGVDGPLVFTEDDDGLVGISEVALLDELVGKPLEGGIERSETEFVLELRLVELIPLVGTIVVLEGTVGKVGAVVLPGAGVTVTVTVETPLGKVLTAVTGTKSFPLSVRV